MGALAQRRVEIEQRESVEFFSTGSTLLDLALGGGWALPRIFNIVGDRSTGKTLLAIEAFANFKRKFPNAQMRYAEAEAAFDESFAEQLGFPTEVGRPEELLDTVEEFRSDLDNFAGGEEGPKLYVLDSLDALSDAAELKKYAKEILASQSEDEEDKKTKGSYGASKAKEMSKLFRVLTRKMKDNNCALGIISQVRDNIGVTFGETQTRSGGRALDFSASQILWLAQIERMTRTSLGETRAVGVKIRGDVKKLKVGNPFRKVDFEIIFGYGIDDEQSMLDWLKKTKNYNDETFKKLRSELVGSREKKDYQGIKQLKEQLVKDSTAIWNRIEENLAPAIRKYVD